MVVADAQRDVRLTFLEGLPGQTVSVGIWLLAFAPVGCAQSVGEERSGSP